MTRAPLQPAMWLSYLSELSTAHLLHAQWEGGMPFHRDAEVPGTVADPMALLPDGAELRLDQRIDGDRRIVAAWPGLLAEIDVRNSVTSIAVVGAELPAVERLLGELKAAAGEVTALPAGSVRMNLWSWHKDATLSTRQVESPTWEEVADNYARRSAAAG